MNRYVTTLIVFFLSGCVSYKVIPEGEILKYKSLDQISIKKENKWPAGAHCFEPLLYVLSIGFIPTHCVDTYSVNGESVELGAVKVTSMQGWVAIFLGPFPQWQYGYSTEANVEKKVKRIMEPIE